MKSLSLKITAILAAVLALTSCKGCDSDVKLKQNVSGKPGEIIVVIEKTDWEGAPGDAIRECLEGEYQILPQPEEKFTLYNVSPAAFSNVFRIHRNILVVSTDDKESEGKLLISKDVWAAPQTILKVSAPDAETAAEFIHENSVKIENTFEQAERDRIIANNIRFQEHSIRPFVEKLTGGEMYFPTGYSVRKADNNFLWISYETTFISQYILVYTYPVTGMGDLDTDRIIEESSAILKKNVPGPVENSYMILAPLPSPITNYIRYNNREFVELRGLWEVQNDYMGGPYVLHAFYDQTGENVIVLHSFVYAPKYDKRNYLRQVESIIYSFEWCKEEK